MVYGPETILIWPFLSDIYQRNAILTLSCSVSGNEFIDKQLAKYSSRSRNLIKTDCRPGSNLAALQTFVGGDAICAVWQQLGHTEHDLPSFTIDMTHYSVWNWRHSEPKYQMHSTTTISA